MFSREKFSDNSKSFKSGSVSRQKHLLAAQKCSLSHANTLNWILQPDKHTYTHTQLSALNNEIYFPVELSMKSHEKEEFSIWKHGDNICGSCQSSSNGGRRKIYFIIHSFSYYNNLSHSSSHTQKLQRSESRLSNACSSTNMKIPFCFDLEQWKEKRFINRTLMCCWKWTALPDVSSSRLNFNVLFIRAAHTATSRQHPHQTTIHVLPSYSARQLAGKLLICVTLFTPISSKRRQAETSVIHAPLISMPPTRLPNLFTYLHLTHSSFLVLSFVSAFSVIWFE